MSDQNSSRRDMSLECGETFEDGAFEEDSLSEDIRLKMSEQNSSRRDMSLECGEIFEDGEFEEDSLSEDIRLKMSEQNSSRRDMSLECGEIFEDGAFEIDSLSEGEESPYYFEEEASVVNGRCQENDDALELEKNAGDNPIKLEVDEAVFDQVSEGDSLYLAEDIDLDQEPAVHIGNIPVFVYNDDDGRTFPVEEQANVDVTGCLAEEPLVDQPTDPEVEGGNHNSIAVQVDLGLSDEECLPNDRVGATAQRTDCESVRGANSRGRGRGRGTALPRKAVWRKGDRLVGVYETDEDIPVRLREQLETHHRRRAMRANEDDVDDEQDYDEQLDNAAAMDDDVMKEYERFCRSDAARFEWKSMASFEGLQEPFQVDRTGPTRVFQNAYDAFREYWDYVVLQLIVDSTNAYGDTVPEAEKTFHKYWYHTNAHEILILFAFWMMLAVLRMPSIKSCFSNDTLLKTNVFRTMFTEGRYWSLTRALRFAPDETAELNPDELRHIRPILNHLNRKFKECYLPSQDIYIDESPTLWRGQPAFCQNTNTKPSKVEMKTYELCESTSGYLWSLFIYTGKSSDTDMSVFNKTVETVLKLIGPLLGKGYRLFVDNFFNSPMLARFLKRKQTDCVGPLKMNQKLILPLITNKKLRSGSYVARHVDDVVVLSQRDRKPLVLISTHHGTEQIKMRERPGYPFEYKLVAVTDYNIGMVGIGKKNETLEPYLVERKQCKWWFSKCFKRLLAVTISNSRVLVKKSGGDTRIQLVFRLELVQDILKKHMQLLPRHRVPTAHRADTGFPSNQFVCDARRFHAIKKMSEERRRGNKRASAQCFWCRVKLRIRSRTSFECCLCKVPLCIEPCFTIFHTQQ